MNPFHFDMLVRDELIERVEIYDGPLTTPFLGTRKIELTNP